MIFGIGCDIIEISRIENSMKNPRFLSENFTESENEYFKSKKYNPQSVAAAFAAKEAFSKALGTGVSGFLLRDVEVLHDELSKPYINPLNNAAAMVGNKKIHLTLSHCEKYAQAVAVIEV